jgi:hypothetical protein
MRERIGFDLRPRNSLSDVRQHNVLAQQRPRRDYFFSLRHVLALNGQHLLNPDIQQPDRLAKLTRLVENCIHADARPMQHAWIERFC